MTNIEILGITIFVLTVAALAIVSTIELMNTYFTPGEVVEFEEEESAAIEREYSKNVTKASKL